jgi:hypothetical protein
MPLTVHSSQMDSDDLLALSARCPMSLAAGGSVIPPIGAVVMACLAHCRGRGHLWISLASSVCPFPMASRRDSLNFYKSGLTPW